MKKHLKRLTVLAVVMPMFWFWSCDLNLDVENTNAPDQDKALASSADVLSLITGSLKKYWEANQITYMGFLLPTMGDEVTCSWGNFGMKVQSSEPRVAWDNSPAYTDADVSEDLWYTAYKGISAASDGLKAVAGGVDLGDDAIRAQAVGKFVLGTLHGALALIYDQAFIVDENTDLSTAQTAQSYTAVMTAAVGYLNESITLCESNTFSFEASWLNRTMDSATLEAWCHAYIARFLADVARRTDERSSASWSTIKTHIDDAQTGLGTDDVYVDGSYSDGWWKFSGYYRNAAYWWGRADYKMIGPADTSGAYTSWDNTAVASRMPMIIHTADQRISAGADTSGALDSNGDPIQQAGTYFYVLYSGTTPSDAGYKWDRGTYHLSYYTYKMDPDAGSLSGPQKEMKAEELDLLMAEYYLHQSDATNAATYINKTRVTNGGMTAASSSDAVGSISDDPSALNSASLWAKYKYEKIIEASGSNPFVSYCTRRGHGDLVTYTPEQFPIPGKELETLLQTNYTFGGSGNAGNAGTAPRMAVKTIGLNSMR